MSLAPIRIGSAATGQLVPAVGSTITTNEYGIDEGTIRFSLGDQSNAQALRPARGSAYSGALPQFRGMFADVSRVIGEAGQACVVEVAYKSLNATWGVPPPEIGTDTELRDTGAVSQGADPLLSGAIPGVTFIPIPHPVISYRFSDSKFKPARGTRGTPPNAPTIDTYAWTTKVVVYSNGTPSNYTITLDFIPDPNGWICLDEQGTPLCGGKIFAISQKWKRFLIYAGATITPA